MDPFELLDYEAPGFLDRMTGAEPERNAYVELHNLIAAAEHPREFGPESRERIGRAHGVDLTRAFADERRALYARYLTHCLADGALTAEERDRLAHLARTLALEAKDLDGVHRKAYGATVSDVLTDDCLSVEERLLLFTMQHTLGLDADHVGAVFDEAARTKLLRRIAHALCDGELSADEAAELEALATGIGVAIPGDVRPLMDRATYRWQLRHGDLPAVELPLRMQTGEIGHYGGGATWFDLNYSRLRVSRSSFRKDFHAHRVAHISVPKEALRRLDTGSVYVTNRRLVLAGGRLKPIELKHSALLGAECYQNGVRVMKKGARSLFVQVQGEADLFHLALSRALNP
ncbi:MAG: hypothetical protein ABJF88_02460 [Rhodothermales bacterium]